MIQESREMSFYDVLDVRKSATPEAIREAYVRAKNAFASDSLATYSLFDRSQSKKMLEEIESAYNVLSDPDKRRRYDQAHGYIRSTEFLADLPNALIEFGEEVSDIGMDKEAKAPPTTAIHEDDIELDTAVGTANQTDSATVSAAGSASGTGNEGNVESFALRYAAANPVGKDSEPLSKNFVPSAATNPNAHYIHKRHEASSEMEELLKHAEAVDGDFLRKAREYRGVSIEEMMEFTKLTRKYIEALEQDAVDKLPAPVYVRGFIMQIAKALQLDTNRVTASYMRNFQSLRETRGLR